MTHGGEISISWTPPASPDLIGYYLYVNDPYLHDIDGDGRKRAAFRKDHPYLRLSPESTSVTLNGLKSCVTYSFYLESINGAGRPSEPSATTEAVSALASPSGGTPATGLRNRLWTGNDAIFASTDAPTPSTDVVRIMEDQSCGSGDLQQSIDLQTWNPVDPGSLVARSFGATAKVKEFTLTPPIGVTTYYRLAYMPDTSSEVDGPPVAFRVPEHQVPPALSPPSHFDAKFPTMDAGTVHLRWCPNFASEQITGYRIFRSIYPKGPFDSSTRITNPDLPPTAYSYDDVNDPSTNPISPMTTRYYYVIVAVRGEDVSPVSPVNGAGFINGSADWDPDSPSGATGSHDWISPLFSYEDELLLFCNDDYVDNRRNPFDPLTSGPDGVRLAACTEGGTDTLIQSPAGSSNRDMTPAPYRTVGVLVIPSHYTYYHLDHLGSPRILTDIDGVRVQGQHFLPFGEEMPIEAGTNTRKFTGHERDAETGLDYMLARYYEAGLGRFLAVDPSQKGAIPLNPQSWNRYVYARNNPIGFLDPNGRDAVASTKNGVTTVTIPVHFTGSGATPAAVRAIVDKDNNLKVTGDSKIKLNVVATDKPVQGVLNTMDLSPGKDKNFAPEGEGTNYLGGDKAHIDTDNVLSNEAASHDVLHFAGIQDRYIDSVDKDGNRTSTPEPGYTDDNVMVTRSGNQIKPEQLQEAVDNPTTKKVPEKK